VPNQFDRNGFAHISAASLSKPPVPS
jgi:hypothetical protein